MKHNTALTPALFIEQPNIQLEAILDPIMPARVPASDIKISVPLLTLSRRQIFPEKPKAPSSLSD